MCGKRCIRALSVVFSLIFVLNAIAEIIFEIYRVKGIFVFEVINPSIFLLVVTGAFFIAIFRLGFILKKSGELRFDKKYVFLHVILVASQVVYLLG